ncbi:MAG: hypothetical protein O8C63_06150, partial [Candidatus Methanoperedens sp.]|nr:hypothetical protein [Candidatus Methanoperedens sp.]
MDDSRAHDLIAQRRGIRLFCLDSTTGRRAQAHESDLNKILPSFREQIESALRQYSDERWVYASFFFRRMLSKKNSRMPGQIKKDYSSGVSSSG